LARKFCLLYNLNYRGEENEDRLPIARDKIVNAERPSQWFEDEHEREKRASMCTNYTRAHLFYAFRNRSRCRVSRVLLKRVRAIKSELVVFEREKEHVSFFGLRTTRASDEQEKFLSITKKD